MKKLFTILFIYMFISGYNAESQETYSVDKWQEYVEQIAEETGDEAKAEALYTELSYLSENPFDLNTVSDEQLRRLPFLSDNQISSLMDYRKRYGKMLSIYELQAVDNFDWQTILLILPFVNISDNIVDKAPITVRNMLKQGRNELQIRYDKCFQQKSGYCSYSDSILDKYPNRKYLGEAFYTSVKYSYAYEDKIQAGLLAEKDMGEPFWKPVHKGYDYYSFHLLLRDFKWLKTLAIGDYKVSFGQGLVISNDFSPSRSALVTQAERRNNGFRRHFSTNESDFFRGAAATVSFGNWDLSAFYSRRRMDAALENDTFPSVQTSGLHRLQRDWDKRKTVVMQTYGGNIRFALPSFHIGMTAVGYDFGGDCLYPSPQPYNLFYFRGKSNFNIGVDYMLKTSWAKIYGETAVSRNGALATLNGLQLSPASYITMLLLHRYYDRKYQSYFGNAFSQGYVQNEQGFYAGLQWSPFPYWKFSGYVDIFRFPWLKYQIDYPSSGKEYMTQVDYSFSSRLSTYLRYKYKQRDGSSTQQRLRFQLSVNAGNWTLRSSADGVLYTSVDNERNKGFMLSQRAGWKKEKFPFQADIYFAYFQTDNYYTRISSYEKNILYAFYMPSFYGEGLRAALTFQWNILKSLKLSVKLAHTYYSDRDVIGTDTEEIKGNNKTDLYAVLSWKF